MAEVIDIRGGDEQAVAKAVSRAAAAVADGQLVAVPDEAGYQLIAAVSDPDSTHRLLKTHLPQESFGPIVLGTNATTLMQMTASTPEPGQLATRLARRCWPAPVVLELNTAANTAATPPQGFHTAAWEAVSSHDWLGVRVPAHEVPRGLLDLANSPLLARALPLTETGEPHTTVLEDAAVVLLAGASRYAGGDTVIRVRGQDWEIIRDGAVGAATVARLACHVVVFVCTGNTCRSPMAEAMFRKLLASRLQCSPEELVDHGLLVGSAGVGTYGGNPISPEAATCLKEIGIESDAHVSQPLTAELANQADQLVAMTQNHLDSILHTWPEAVTRTRLLDPNGTDIDDPFGASSAVYTDCCHTIETHLNTLVCDLFDDQTRPGL